MADKLLVSLEVAEAIEHLKDSCRVSALIKFADGEGGFLHPKMKLLRQELDREALLHAIFYGYEIEKTPEEKLAEYIVDRAYAASGECPSNMRRVWAGEANGARKAAEILGIELPNIHEKE